MSKGYVSNIEVYSDESYIQKPLITTRKYVAGS